MRFNKLVMAFATVAACVPAGSDARPPKVVIDYLPLLDLSCRTLTKAANTEAVVDELGRRLPQFRSAWAANGPPLLAQAERTARTPFRFRETRAALHGCRGLPSMSLPLTINMEPHLRAAVGDAVEPDFVFVNTVFHEVLHRYVSDTLLPTGTPLLRRYASEPPPVRGHLHLFALETLVYRRLGRDAELAGAIAQENKLRGALAFQRARAIVAAEGPERFVAELTARR